MNVRKRITWEDLTQPRNETTPQAFRAELIRLRGIAITSGWTTLHVAEALGISMHTLKAWMRGEGCPATPAARDAALTMIVHKLELRPI